MVISRSSGRAMQTWPKRRSASWQLQLGRRGGVLCAGDLGSEGLQLDEGVRRDLDEELLRGVPLTGGYGGLECELRRAG